MKTQFVRAVAFGLVATGCHPEVIAFHADPGAICPGQEVVVSWEVVGTPELAFSPQVADAPSGTLATRGSVRVHPTAATRATLHVTRMGDTTDRPADINLPAPVRVAADLNDSARCEDGLLTLTAHLSGVSADLRAELVTVEASEPRAYDITRMDAAHQPITAHVARGVSTAAFATLPMLGDWILASPLSGSERCPAGADPGHIPHVLTVYAYTGCKGGQS